MFEGYYFYQLLFLIRKEEYLKSGGEVIAVINHEYICIQLSNYKGYFHRFYQLLSPIFANLSCPLPNSFAFV